MQYAKEAAKNAVNNKILEADFLLQQTGQY
jgi:hypothetical protein